MVFHEILKLLIREVLKGIIGEEAIEHEVRLTLAYKIPDIIINYVKVPNVPRGSWLYYVLSGKYKKRIIEIQNPYQPTKQEKIIQVIDYMMVASAKYNMNLRDILGVLICPSLPTEKLPEFIEKVRGFKAEVISEDLIKSVITKTGDEELMRIRIIEIDKLQPNVDYNEILLIFSKDIIISRRAHRIIARKYDPGSLIYFWGYWLMPEEYPRGPELPDRTVAEAIRKIGIEKVSRALKLLGLEEFIKTIGLRDIMRALVKIYGKDKIVEEIENADKES